MEAPKNINEYYKYYLTLHKNKTCRLLHFLGQLNLQFGYFGIGTGILFRQSHLLYILLRGQDTIFLRRMNQQHLRTQ